MEKEEEGGVQPSTSSPAKPCDLDDSAINCDPSIGPVAAQSPFFAAQKVSGLKSSPPAALKSIIKYPQQQQQQQATPADIQHPEPVIQHQQSIEFELIQPPTVTQLDCEVIFTSERIQPEEKIASATVVTTANIDMSSESKENNPTIAINAHGADASDLFDPWCDPKNPRIVQFQDISAAAFKIKSGIMMTPCTRSHLSSMTETQIFFKKDFLQYTGSFKVISKFEIPANNCLTFCHNWIKKKGKGGPLHSADAARSQSETRSVYRFGRQSCSGSILSRPRARYVHQIFEKKMRVFRFKKWIWSPRQVFR